MFYGKIVLLNTQNQKIVKRAITALGEIMKIYFKVLGSIIFILLISNMAFAAFKGSFPGDETPPSPELIYPTTENLNLAGKAVIEFKWISNNYIWFSGYEFKLYKGYQTTADTLIHSEKAASSQSVIKLPVSIFEAGQVYTWKLRSITTGGQRSDWSSSSFKFINNS